MAKPIKPLHTGTAALMVVAGLGLASLMSPEFDALFSMTGEGRTGSAVSLLILIIAQGGLALSLLVGALGIFEGSNRSNPILSIGFFVIVAVNRLYLAFLPRLGTWKLGLREVLLYIIVIVAVAAHTLSSRRLKE